MEGQSKPSYKKYIILLWSSLLGLVSIVFILFLLAAYDFFGKMPSFEELENPKTNYASEIISADGQTIGTFFNENRIPVTFKEIPEHLIQGLTSTEDKRYYEHYGIDIRRTITASLFLGTRGGASTITQQLAKLLFHGDGAKNPFARILQKIKEWIIAIRLERQYTKEEIITMYLNKYDFLYQAVGLRSGSKTYFNKLPAELEIHESAMLVAMLKNPILYNPVKTRFKKNALNRRNQVLSLMHRNGYLTDEQKDTLQAKPLGITFKPQGHKQGIATYFREYLRSSIKQWSATNENKYNIYKDGLKIYTTIDTRMQRYAEEAVNKHLPVIQREFDAQNEDNPTAPFFDVDLPIIEEVMDRAIQRSHRWKTLVAQGKTEDEIDEIFNQPTPMTVFTWEGTKDTVMTPLDSIKYYKSIFHTGLMSMDPQTGAIKAWVGGINYNYFQYDHVAYSKRQVGSTFKPFVYATAIDQLHLSPCYELPNVLTTIEAGKYGNMKDWTPKNAGNRYGGSLSLKEALARSVNTITAALMNRVGPAPVVRLAKKAGIKSPLIEVPSIALGTMDLSVFEMVSAYGTFANKGVHVTPQIITRIEDRFGRVIYEPTIIKTDVLREEIAHVILSLMMGVTEYGSGERLRGSDRTDYLATKVLTGYPYNFENPIAGKTGTSQNHADGWFIGIVPNLVTGVWVGAEDRTVHFPTIAFGQGATTALPIWGQYMQSCYADSTLNISMAEFEKPEKLDIQIECEENKFIEDNANVEELPF